MPKAALLLLGLVGATVLADPARSQAYPAKPIRLIVPNAPGGGTDTMARLVADRVGPAIGQQIVVDNRAGGGGRIAGELAARAPKDGHTLLLGSNSVLITGPAASKLAYDPIRDFTGISLLARTAYILAAHPSVPARSVKDIVAIAKSRKASLAYGSTGPGSAAHLGMALVEAMTGATLVHVPFKGSVPAMLSITQGEIDVMFGNYQATLPLIRAGRLRAIGVSSPTRSVLAPDLPTLHETGLSGFDMQQYYSIVAPAGTPQEVIQRLNQEIVKRLPGDDAARRLSAEGIEIATSTPVELDRLNAAQLAIWTKVIRVAGIRLD